MVEIVQNEPDGKTNDENPIKLEMWDTVKKLEKEKPFAVKFISLSDGDWIMRVQSEFLEKVRYEGDEQSGREVFFTPFGMVTFYLNDMDITSNRGEFFSNPTVLKEILDAAQKLQPRLLDLAKEGGSNPQEKITLTGLSKQQSLMMGDHPMLANRIGTTINYLQGLGLDKESRLNLHKIDRKSV